MVEFAELTGDRGLSSSRIAREDRVEHQVPIYLETTTATLQREARLIGHRHNPLLHAVESDHGIEFAHAFLKSRASGSQFIEGDITLTKQGGLVVFHQRHCALEIAGHDLVGNESADVAESPVGQRPLFPPLENGLREFVSHHHVGL